jgi:RHS repeat-associated protein
MPYDVGYYQVETTGAVPGSGDILSLVAKVRKPGYIYVYISNENAVAQEVYFDNLKIKYVKSPVLQYNEYYPFGLQNSNTFTRTGAKNNYLYDAGNELNATTDWYETFFRGYDAALGKFLQVDPMADKFASISTYNYGLNNPILFNDPAGAEVNPGRGYASFRDRGYDDASTGMYGDNWNYLTYGGGFEMYGVGVSDGPDAPNYAADAAAVANNEMTVEEYAQKHGESFSGFVTFTANHEGATYALQVQFTAGVAENIVITAVTNTSGGGFVSIVNGSIPFTLKNGEWSFGGTKTPMGTEGNGFRLQYSDGLDKVLSTLGGVAGTFESGAAIGTFQRVAKASFSASKAGLKLTKGFGAAGLVLTGLVVAHELATGHDNTHTWVDVGVTVVSVGAVAVLGTVALPAVAIGGLAYGIWSFAVGSDWIDENWGYRKSN